MKLATHGLKKQLQNALSKAKAEDAKRYAEAVVEARKSLKKSIAADKQAVIDGEKILAANDGNEIMKFTSRYPRIDEISHSQAALQRAVDLIGLVTEAEIDSKEANKLIGNVLNFL